MACHGGLMTEEDDAENAERNAVIEEVAQELDKFAGPFGRDTVQSFAAFVRGMKK